MTKCQRRREEVTIKWIPQRKRGKKTSRVKVNRWWSLSSEEGSRLYIAASRARKDKMAEAQMLARERM